MMIRYLNEDDIDNCLALMELVKDNFAGYQEREFVQAMYHAAETRTAFIQYEGEDVAGLIAFSYKNSEITFLAVNPRFRNRGIAKMLINEVIKQFRPGTMLQVVTFRGDDPKGKAAVACYHSCGFRDDIQLEAYGYPCQRMVKWL